MIASESLKIGTMCLAFSILFPTHFQIAISQEIGSTTIIYSNLWMCGFLIDIVDGFLRGLLVFEIPFIYASAMKLISFSSIIITIFSSAVFFIMSISKKSNTKKILLLTWSIQFIFFLAYTVFYSIFFIPSVGSFFFVLGMIFTFKGTKNAV